MTPDDFKETKYWKLVEEFLVELRTAKYWFENDGNPNAEWLLFETRDAARNAARNAAGDAAWDAAWDAARNAAWDAARNAAGVAAWDAAWDAARNAAWDAALFARMIICMGLKIENKHLLCVNARMEVWRKGYGLLCDINGKLYVYKKW